jgi:hypothetical protein
MAATKQFSREELYNLVWSKPITHIIKDYAYTGDSFKRICYDHKIPLPMYGFWTNVRFKRKVVKTPLPPGNENIKIELIIRQNGLDDFKNTFSELDIMKQDLLMDKELTFWVPNKLTNPHKYTIATKKYHDALNANNKSGNGNTNINRNDVLNIEVSNHLWTRALKLMDTLLKLFEKRGYTVVVSNYTKITVNGQSYGIRLAERYKRVKHENAYGREESEMVATGLLCLKLDTYVTIKEWLDTKAKPLEDKLLEILAWIELKAKKDNEPYLEAPIWQENDEKIIFQDISLKNQNELELEKFKDLLAMATRWQKAQYLRSFIKELESKNLKLPIKFERLEDGIEWAKEKADWYDPLIEQEDDLLQNIDRDTLKPLRDYRR